ncbi:MAG: hemolysin family protein [Planctomycetota bacterium]
MTLIIVVASVTLFASFLCSILEAALYAITPSQLEVLKKKRVLGARRFARFRESPDEAIAAILTVNTVAHTVGAAWLGALVSAEGGMSLGLFTAIFTLLVLAGTELVPKSIGVRYAPRLVPILAMPLQIIVWISWPLARPAKTLMGRLTGSQKSQSAPTEEEIIAMSKIAARGGELTSREMRWVENALLLDSVSARDLMTPRPVVQSIDAETTITGAVEFLASKRHSRFPVYEGEPDKLIGLVHRRDVHDLFVRGEAGMQVRDVIQPLDIVHGGTKGPQLLERFIREKRHMIAVLDEYGGLEGIVTLEDVLECLLGAEIVDEHDEHEDMQEFARERALSREIVESRLRSNGHSA